ncbi:MAG: hypothetical protein KKI07_01565 [Euryarchaeota archaeon]|nr:hypothetical protein [Euryarchaeota archaeon]MDI6902545.1 hypothetical protein [Methanocellales archaeon]
MKIEEILFWLFILFVLVLLVWKLTGSPNNSTMIAALVGALVLLWRDFSNFKAEVKEFMGEMREKLK